MSEFHNRRSGLEMMSWQPEGYTYHIFKKTPLHVSKDGIIAVGKY